jgi:hypothetical protein
VWRRLLGAWCLVLGSAFSNRNNKQPAVNVTVGGYCTERPLGWVTHRDLLPACRPSRDSVCEGNERAEQEVPVAAESVILVPETSVFVCKQNGLL